MPLNFFKSGAEPKRKVILGHVSTASKPGTLLGAAGIPVQEECEGGSLLLLQKRSKPPDEHVFFEHYFAN